MHVLTDPISLLITDVIHVLTNPISLVITGVIHVPKYMHDISNNDGFKET
jgi:hypothetical protein